MSEEKKEEQKKEEPKKEEKPQAKAPEAASQAAPQAAPKPAAAGGESGEAKKPKLSSLSLKEVDEELKKCQEKMGGLYSQYARFLLARKKVLSGK